MISVKKRNITFEGKSVEYAIKKAMETLNVSKDDMDIKIVSEEKRGLFGMEGEKPAKIIVNLKNKNKH
jgi:spoIIIJ-associated protein